MDKALGLLDHMPAWARHAAIAGGAAAGGTITKAIITAQGVTGVPWGDTLRDTVDAGFLAATVAISVLVVTPLTRQYGIFKNK